MSVLVYGGPPGVLDPTQGVALSYINTRAISDEPQYSDDGTEYLYTKRVVQATCIFNANLAPALLGETPAVTMGRVRHALQLPRKQLLFFHNTIFDPVPLIASPQSGKDRDAKHGPFCRHVNITQIQGSECFLVDVEYETYVNECSAGGLAPFYISHRWREDSTIDERFFTTRTRVGKIVVQADQSINPSSLRGIVSPPIPVGFLRQSSQYILQEDGLAMQYTFVDREVYVTPPAPAVKAEGEYFESTADGATRWGECRVKLYGAKVDPSNANVAGGKGALLQLAITIVVTKLRSAGINTDKDTGAWIAIGGIREDLYDNVVEVRFKAQLRPGLGTLKKTSLDLSRFVEPPFGSDFLHPVAPDPGTGGTAQLGLDVGIANLINDPCLGNLQIVEADTFEATAPVGSDEIPYPIIAITPQLPDDLSIFDNSEDTGIYTDYQIHKQYRHNDYQIHLPTTMSTLNTSANSPASPLPAGGTVGPAEAPSAVVTVAAGTTQIVIEWIAERTGTQPKIPQFYLNDSNVVLMTAIFDPGMMAVAGDGASKKWRMRGCNTYAVLDRTKLPITAGVPPYVVPSISADAVIDVARIVAGITDNPLTSLTNVMLQTQTSGTSP